MGKQRRSYTDEFELNAVRAAGAGNRSLNQVARDLGINPSLLQNWKQQLGSTDGRMREETLEQEKSATPERERLAAGGPRSPKKSGGVLCERTPVKYAFIEEQRTQHSVRRMCNLFDVSPAGFYEWPGRAPSARACSDAVLRGEIVDIHEDSRWSNIVSKLRARQVLRSSISSEAFTIRIAGIRQSVQSQRSGKNAGFTKLDVQAITLHGSEPASHNCRQML